MSFQNLVLRAVLKITQRLSMRLSAQHRFRRNRKFLSVDRSKVGSKLLVQAGQLGGVPVEWVRPKRLANHPHTPICLYFHGGAFVMGSLNSHRDMAAYLAEKAGITLLMVDYRLAPEHPFPAALDDAMAVYRALIAQGIPSQRLLMAGDSAGGNITLACLQVVRDERLALPAAFFLFSPWLDLKHDSPSHSVNASTDLMLNTQLLDEAVAMYAPGVPREDARLSPLQGHVGGLPPCLLIASSSEILRDDALRLQLKIQAEGGSVDYVEWKNTPHAFPVLARFLPEARSALDETARFIGQFTHHQLGDPD